MTLSGGSRGQSPALSGLELVVEKLVPDGVGLARLPDGQVLLVRGAAPGDRIRLSSVEKQRGALWAKGYELLQPSEQRVRPECPVAERCGGCDLMHLSREAESSVRQQLVDQIVEANAFDVPRSWVERMALAYAEAYQVPEADREKFAQEFRPVAERQVRRDMIVDAIAEREGLSATEADVDDKIAEAAQARNLNPGQLYASLQKAGRLQEIERGITEEKVFKYLIEQNAVNPA